MMKFVVWNANDGIVRVLEGEENRDYALELADTTDSIVCEDNTPSFGHYYQVENGELFIHFYPLRIQSINESEV